MKIMRPINKSVLVFISILLLTAFVGSSKAHASSRDQDDFAREMANRFGLNEYEVSRFMREYNRDTRVDHLMFIEDKLEIAVNRRKITNAQKRAIMSKIEALMRRGPNTGDYKNMPKSELNKRITEWKQEMTEWAKDNGLTLSKIRSITGKGNKYLMGVEL